VGQGDPYGQHQAGLNGNFIAAETEKWRKTVKFAGIKPE
jgi:hypothetical protein